MSNLPHLTRGAFLEVCLQKKEITSLIATSTSCLTLQACFIFLLLQPFHLKKNYRNTFCTIEDNNLRLLTITASTVLTAILTEDTTPVQVENAKLLLRSNSTSAWVLPYLSPSPKNPSPPPPAPRHRLHPLPPGSPHKGTLLFDLDFAQVVPGKWHTYHEITPLVAPSDT